jgi:integrin-linked kinase-associated serine/threonine phosphatase 2C
MCNYLENNELIISEFKSIK